ncbi:MAG TPA: hypothetical protein VN915_08190 [Elusimicrobiota bacterium]|nr:hypothetical protein [Elusimicrobiota bacterium]
MELVEMLKEAVREGASDIRIVIGRRPLMSVDGQLEELDTDYKLNAEESKRLVYSMLYVEQREDFEKRHEIEASFSVYGLCRIRMNATQGKNGIEAILHIIDPRDGGTKKPRRRPGSNGPPPAGKAVLPINPSPFLSGGAEKEFPQD